MRSCSRSAAGVCATVRAGFADGVAAGPEVWNRPISTQPASIKAGHSSTAAQPARLQNIPRAFRNSGRGTPPARKRRVAICLCPAGLVLAGHFNLRHTKRLDPRTAARLDEAADANLL